MKVRFYNSTEYVAFWKTLLNELRKCGCEVSHPYVVDQKSYANSNGRWSQIKKLWQTYVVYCLKIFFTRRDQADAYVATTSPFCAPAVLRIRHGRKGRTIFLLYDLFPDAMELSGMIRPRGLASRVLAAFTKYALRKSSATVFLGKQLQAHVESRYGRVNNPVIIPVGADGSPFSDSPPKPIPEQDLVRILYSGNMGRAHDGETVLEHLRSNRSHEKVEWMFHAFGKGYNEFKQCLHTADSSANLTLSGPLSDSDWIEVMRTAHVALVTMRPGWETVVMPSKTYSAMVAGQAILAICPSESDLAELVREHNCGWVVPPGDITALRTVVERLTKDRCEVDAKRRNSYEAGHRLYDCSVVAKQWYALLTQKENSQHFASVDPKNHSVDLISIESGSTGS